MKFYYLVQSFLTIYTIIILILFSTLTQFWGMIILQQNEREVKGLYNSSCVLVCLSGKNDCSDLIAAGNALAKRDGLKLSILVVLPQKACFSPDRETLNMLYAQSKKYKAELNVFFDDAPVQCAANFARKSHTFSIVTGFPDLCSSHFVSKLHSALPEVPISMVKGNRVFHVSDELLANREKKSNQMYYINF